MIRKFVFTLIFLLFCNYSFTQISIRGPSIGYIYPAGGQKGTSFEILIGGQNLRNPREIYFSISEIKAEEITYIPSLSLPQKGLLMRQIREIVTSKLKGTTPKLDFLKQTTIKLPEHPFLNDLENKTMEEMRRIIELFLIPMRTEQVKRSIQEKILARITIPEDTKPGIYELRVLTPQGLTNPLKFYVSEVPEVKEKEKIPLFENIDKEVFEVPIIINGQIMPGDIDKFYFKAQKGQNLIIELKGREIIPFMADAVPGWFQAVLKLYGPDGKEIAYADDYYFNPDPVIFFKVPEDGEYTLEVRDSIYRGREDFVYRIFIGEKPFITYIFPPGGRKDAKVIADLYGWNLPNKKIELNTENQGIQKISISNNGISSNYFFYEVNTLPEIIEIEPNDTLKNAYDIGLLPVIINGVISKPSDVDIYKFRCFAGCKLAIEVYSRRLGYPLDSRITLIDSSGKVLISNDDYLDKSFDFLTHHADSYIFYEIQKTGTYYLKITDTQNHGGEEYIYRIRISHPMPDFSLFVYPSYINLTTLGNTIPLYIYVVRKDGFNGEIKLNLKNPHSGLVINGGRIPPNTDKICITISLTPSFVAIDKPFPIQIEGIANIEEKIIKKMAQPAEEMMQAFAYFHLVPSSELIVFARRRFFQPPLLLLNENNVYRIPSGGSTKIECKVLLKNEKISLELKEPLTDFTIENLNIENDILSFDIKANKKVKPGLAGNIILEIFSEREFQDNTGKIITQKTSRGFLPAIMFEII
ncbi:MAG: PPC domain-containing protein [Candidatus Omnitrophica bacterium]|nr:PPC domain-containing protein [Candidatus Omnitrophota bacterium]